MKKTAPKFDRIPPHTRIQNGKTVHVRGHLRRECPTPANKGRR